VATGRDIEVRLAARASLAPASIARVTAVVFGEGDFHQRTEDRPAPPTLHPGDRLRLGPLRATVDRLLEHPRLVALTFDGTPHDIWEGVAHHGRPIQYAHVPSALALWDSWTSIAGPPVAFEPPSAGFALSWRMLAAFAQRGIRFSTLTHAAGISSTGDAVLDARLPFDEPYAIPLSTARLVNAARDEGRRIIAVGTSVVRALEHAARLGSGRVEAIEALASGRIGPCSQLEVVNAVLTGTHEPGTSHYDLLGAFATSATLARMDVDLNRLNYRTHEFGDSVFIEASRLSVCVSAAPCRSGASPVFRRTPSPASPASRTDTTCI
jgi:S-adenosylmethionine:tRNA ribosyltransferase-isomerase